MYATDRENVDRLSSRNPPEDIDLVDLARLTIRYADFNGADDLKVDIQKFMKKWNLDREKLEKIIDQTLKGETPKAGSYRGRTNSEPEHDRKTLMEPKNA